MLLVCIKRHYQWPSRAVIKTPSLRQQPPTIYHYWRADRVFYANAILIALTFDLSFHSTNYTTRAVSPRNTVNLKVKIVCPLTYSMNLVCVAKDVNRTAERRPYTLVNHNGLITRRANRHHRLSLPLPRRLQLAFKAMGAPPRAPRRTKTVRPKASEPRTISQRRRTDTRIYRRPGPVLPSRRKTPASLTRASSASALW